MKKLNLLSIFTLITVAFFASCSDDDVESTVPGDFVLNEPVSISSEQAGTTIDINAENISDALINLNWQNPSATPNTVIRHTIQIAKPGTSFATPVDISTIIGNGASISGTALNTAVSKLGGAIPGINEAIELRVNSSVDDESYLASNVLSFTVNPFNPNAPEDAFLYLAENYPDWNFLEAQTVTSPNDDGIYGSPYFVFQDATSFNVVDPSTGNVWGANDDINGQFIQDGSPIVIENAGMYNFQLNPSAETFTAMQQIWGIIGPATPMGWDDETPLLLDLGTGIWSGVIDLVEGDFKFRANHNWDINVGDNNLDGSLEPGGADIPNTLVGLTSVVLDFSDAFNPTYQIGEAAPIEPIESGNFLYFSTDDMTTMGMENIYSVDANGKYAGFAYLSTGETYSLIDPELEDGAVQNTMTVDDTALYWVTVDLTVEQMSSYKLDSWGIIGPASPTGGWEDDFDMTFDPMNKTITGMVALTTGDYKFRANGEWEVDLGDDDADGKLDEGGSDIMNATAGTYTLTIDLSDDSGYEYTIQ